MDVLGVYASHVCGGFLNDDDEALLDRKTCFANENLGLKD